MKVKTSELSGAQLDWVVAKAQGVIESTDPRTLYYRPSTVWSHGGTIIEREGMSLEFRPMGSMHEWAALSGDEYAGGETPLIAAMRCFVACKLGEEVEVPEIKVEIK